MISRLTLLSAAASVALSAAAEFSLSEDFTVTDVRGGAYGIVPAHDTALSHRHGWIEDGAYRIPVEGNRHVLATPRLRDFHLEADCELVPFVRLDLTMGFKVYFRHDLLTKRGEELAVYFDHDRKLHFALNGRELLVSGRDSVPSLSAAGDGTPALPKSTAPFCGFFKLPLESKLVLDVQGDRGTVEAFGEKVSFDVGQSTCGGIGRDGSMSRPPAGRIAFDQTQSESVKLILKRISLNSPDPLPTTRVGRWHFVLPQSQGSAAAPVYDVAADRYASGEVAVRVALSGCLMGCAPRQDTGGFAWTMLQERITAPYVRFTLPDGSGESRKGDAVVILSDESPLYCDTAHYPATFRFTVSHPGIGRAQIAADAPYAVVSRSADRLVIRTVTDKDTALCFRFGMKGDSTR